ncbi:MAG: GNAT family N-acetyltransferase [Planctomycetes bacterium]|nr:GNAT family N-acetyltransferase [Planctomycetota bacterium]
MTVAIRELQPQDLAALRQLYFDSRRDRFTWVDPARFALDDFDVAIQGETILVALDGEVPVGFVAWWPPENFIHSLFVHPAHQRRGIGTALLSACLAQIGRPVQLKCAQANEAALAFYRSHGWTVDGEGVGPDGEYYLMTCQ